MGLLACHYRITETVCTRTAVMAVCLRDLVAEARCAAAAVGCSGELWRTMRLAWQPAFQSGSLEGYTGLMDDCAAQLAQVGARGPGRGNKALVSSQSSGWHA